MQPAAKLLEAAIVPDIGGGIAIGGGHQIRVQYADSVGTPPETTSPRRHDERCALTDLEAMRAAAADKLTRSQHLAAMATEAQRLEDEAEAG